MAFWRIVNPPTRALAGLTSWWVVLETTGRRTGTPVRVPLASGPVEDGVAWLIAVHGYHASFVRNIVADPRVRLNIRGRWYTGAASICALDGQALRRFNLYARMGPRTMGIDPQLVRIELHEPIGHESGMHERGLIRRLLPMQNRVINPLVCALLDRGLAPPTYALIETVGRRTGRRRRVPVANGLDGNTFWLIAALGHEAAYVRNIEAHPRVRIKARPARLRDGVRMRWRSGTAEPLPEDDARARHRQLGRGRPGYRLDGILLRGLANSAGSDMLTIRIDLDH